MSSPATTRLKLVGGTWRRHWSPIVGSLAPESAAARLIAAGMRVDLAPRILEALTIVEPETVVRWHRAGFRSFWRWKSSRRAGRPSVPPEIRRLIREMSLPNPLWGAPRIHGELLKLGIDVGQTSVAKYMARRSARFVK